MGGKQSVAHDEPPFTVAALEPVVPKDVPELQRSRRHVHYTKTYAFTPKLTPAQRRRRYENLSKVYKELGTKKQRYEKLRAVSEARFKLMQQLNLQEAQFNERVKTILKTTRPDLDYNTLLRDDKRDLVWQWLRDRERADKVYQIRTLSLSVPLTCIVMCTAHSESPVVFERNKMTLDTFTLPDNMTLTRIPMRPFALNYLPDDDSNNLYASLNRLAAQFNAVGQNQQNPVISMFANNTPELIWKNLETLVTQVVDKEKKNIQMRVDEAKQLVKADEKRLNEVSRIPWEKFVAKYPYAAKTTADKLSRALQKRITTNRQAVFEYTQSLEFSPKPLSPFVYLPGDPVPNKEYSISTNDVNESELGETSPAAIVAFAVPDFYDHPNTRLLEFVPSDFDTIKTMEQDIKVVQVSDQVGTAVYRKNGVSEKSASMENIVHALYAMNVRNIVFIDASCSSVKDDMAKKLTPAEILRFQAKMIEQGVAGGAT